MRERAPPGGSGGHSPSVNPFTYCQANSAQLRQSRPDSCLSLSQISDNSVQVLLVCPRFARQRLPSNPYIPIPACEPQLFNIDSERTRGSSALRTSGPNNQKHRSLGFWYLSERVLTPLSLANISHSQASESCLHVCIYTLTFSGKHATPSILATKPPNAKHYTPTPEYQESPKP